MTTTTISHSQPSTSGVIPQLPAPSSPTALVEVSLPWTASAEKQPAHIGAGYIIHTPMAVVEALPPGVFETLKNKGYYVKVEKSQPCFLKTSQTFARISFHRGDTEAHLLLYKLLKSRSSAVYKNWL